MPDLATITDLEDALGRALTDAEAARAPALLGQASTKLRGFCRRQFDPVDGDELILRPVGAVLRLPNRPVSAVSQVAQMGHDGTVAQILTNGTDWSWAGLDEVELWPGGPPPWSDLPDRYQVVYDHGGVPVFIRDKAVEMTLRTLLAPTMAQGLVQERIGQYAYQYGQFPGGQSPGPTVVMTEADERELRLAGYRPSAATIATRAG